MQLRFDSYAASGLLDEAEDLRQPQPRSFAWLLCGEEGLEDPGEDVVWNSFPVIVDGQADVMPRPRFPRPRGCVVNAGIERFQREYASRRHGVTGIDGQIQDTNLIFTRVRC
jgi:hypothetical protein